MLLLTVLLHFFITSPSYIHGLFLNVFYRLFSKNLKNLKINKDVDNIIVLIHGRNSHPNQFTKIYEYIQNNINNYKLHNYTIFCPHLQDGCSSIDDDAYSVYNQIHKAFNPTKTKNLIFVGISKGGLTAMKCGTLRHSNFNVKKIITISSPLQGTYITKFALCPITKRELSYNSNTTLEIEGEINKRKIATYHIVPVWDHLIIPANSCQYYFTPEERIYYHRQKTNHGTIQYKQVVCMHVVDWIFNDDVN